MRIQEEPEARQKLAVFGSGFSQMAVELVKGSRKYVRMATYSPNDLRFKVNSIRLDLFELQDLCLFLKTMLDKADELIGTIPENRLSEDEMFIKDLHIHYMIRRNRVDTRLSFARETGVGIRLQLPEARELHAIIEEVVSGW